jgi:Bacterial SH3 domain
VTVDRGEHGESIRATPEFAASHVVPDGGMPAWDEPDQESRVSRLDARLPVRVVEQRTHGWARVVEAHGSSVWVEERRLRRTEPDTAIPTQQSARTHDVAERLWAWIDDAMAAYRRLLEDIETKRVDEAAARQRALDAGLLVENGEAWLIDITRNRVHHYDGFRLDTIDLPVAGAPRENRGEGSEG